MEHVASQVAALQQVMWADGGLLRSESLLLDGLEMQKQIEANLRPIGSGMIKSRPPLEAVSLLSVARAILSSANARKESRGAHFRNDFPQHDDSHFQKHSIYTADGLVRFESW